MGLSENTIHNISAVIAPEMVRILNSSDLFRITLENLIYATLEKEFGEMDHELRNHLSIHIANQLNLNEL